MELMKLAYLFFLVIIPCSVGKLVSMDEYRDMLVDMHNTFRGKISAADMREIVWDSHLADKAGYWSKWCTYERHNHKHHTKYGENLYVGKTGDNQRVIFDGLQDWYDQGDVYNYQPFQVKCGDTCGYTQLVWANTAKVGCAMNKCGRLFNGYQTLRDAMLFVCFYESRGNIPAEFPYQAGIQCSDCQPGTVCRDKLCSDDLFEPIPVSQAVSSRSAGQDKLPQDQSWGEHPAYMYAEGRPTSHYTNYVDRRRYPADLRYRRTHHQQLRRRQEEERRRQQESERRRQQEESERQRQQESGRQTQRQQEEDRRRRQDEDERRRRQQFEAKRTPVIYERRPPHRNTKETPSEYYARSQYSYTDEYSRVCSCQCRRNTPAPYISPTRSYVSPIRQYGGDLTQPEKYELISVHNLMRDERKLPRIHWNAELEKWTTYIIRCDTEFPGPRHTYTNFGKMVSNEDLYTFVHAWGSEGNQVNGREKHCRATENNTTCNRHNNLMEAEIRGFACATSRCPNHRQIVCLYR